MQLAGSRFSRPKPLLLLAYVTLEGPQPRSRLAELFWHDDAVLAKKLAKLSVVLAQFKKEGAAEVLLSQEAKLASSLNCDAQAFSVALAAKDYAQAITLYTGSFLQGFDLTKLELSPELSEWLLDKREAFANQAQLALLELAESSHAVGNLLQAQQLAERAYYLPDAVEPEPSLLNRMNMLLSNSSDMRKQLKQAVANSLGELDETSRQVFLALALQDISNLTIVRNALKLSLSETDAARETLILNGLIDPDTRILARDMARNWLLERPTERMPLMLALARATPPEGAYQLYKNIFERTQGFGGMGDLPRARAAYYHEAKRHMALLEYVQAAQILSEARSVESLLEAGPEPESYFLEAYALERQGQYKEALKLLDTLSTSNPNITALRSVLLWRTGKSREAETAAKDALNSDLDWLWARATASNALGYLAYADDDLLRAATFFKKSASLFQLAGEKNRWVGSLNNYATTLDQLVTEAETNHSPDVAFYLAETEAAFATTLSALEASGADPLMKVRILINQGKFWEGRKNWLAAEASYLQAQPLLQGKSNRELSARLSLNLGVIYLQLDRGKEAESYFSQAVSDAAEAGEYAIQGIALANYAFLKNDSDSMEIALELLEKSGNVLEYEFFLRDYEQILRHNLERALLANSQRQAERVLGKFAGLYQKRGRASELSRVAKALSLVPTISDLAAHSTQLMNLLVTQE